MASIFQCASCGGFHTKEGGWLGTVEVDVDPRLCVDCAKNMVKCEQCGYFYTAESMTTKGECFPCYVENTSEQFSVDIPVGVMPLREILCW